MRTHWLPALAWCAALTVVGCAYRLESPTPHVASVQPRIVCAEQLNTTLNLMGDHFTPLPIRTLGGFDGGRQPQALQLPGIFLDRSFALDGMTAPGSGADGGGVRVLDDYDSPATSHVTWTSETAMTFDVYPQLMLTPGIYDVIVENPDGQRAVLAAAFAAVPPPHLENIMPMSICVDQADQMLTLNGTGFLGIGGVLPRVAITPEAGGMARTYTPTMTMNCSAIAERVMAGIQSCTSATITIRRGDLTPGRYLVELTNPEPANCRSTERVVLIVAPPPTVTSVTPRTICQGGGTLTVSGDNFQSGASVTLGMTRAGTVMVTNPMQLTASFSGASAGFTPGMMYDLTVRNPDGCEATLRNAVTAVAGPVLFFADPPVVYNGITTRVTLYSTSVRAPLMSVRMTTMGGMPITLVASIDPMHPNRILATVPMGTPAGTYDIEVNDGSGCPATLTAGLRVVAMTTLSITAIDPPFGWQMGTTAVTITAGGGLMPTPRAYLNPHTAAAGTVATALSSVAFVSATRLTAIVPSGVDPAANPYDLIIVNPDGTVGVMTMPDPALYRSVAAQPPVIDSISPVAVPNTGPPPVTINGQNFRMPMVTFRCVTNVMTGARMTFPATVTTSTGTSITINNPPVTTLTAPSLCTIRVTNADGSYGEFVALAISNSSGNLSVSLGGPNLPEARRAVALMSASATRAARFLYAVGGDNGAPMGALDSVATIDTNETGFGAAWFTQRYRMLRPRTLTASAALGRYLYVVGGNDATGPVGTVERAMVLDPLQAPQITDVDIAPAMGTGLAGGIYNYKVSAVMPMTDPDNPGGETLASDVFPIQIPDLMQRLRITLTWRAVPGAAGYIVYRTPMPGMIVGQERELATVMGGTTTTFTDMGGATMAGQTLPLGSTGRWHALASLGGARESAAVVFGADPADATRSYLYATFGRNSGAATATYEFLPVTTAAGTGQQTPAAAWIAGTAVSSAARSQHSAYSATNANASFVAAGTNFIYVGGGTSNGTVVVMNLDSARVQAGGQLTAWAATGATIRLFGHGATLAANYLYSFGDEMPSDSIRAGQITMGAAPAIMNFNNNGNRLTAPRYLPGTTQQGAYIYVAGGSNAGRTSATNTVEAMIW